MKNKAAAAQATFKSIRALKPLFDRVLVQRLKPETVRPYPYQKFAIKT